MLAAVCAFAMETLENERLRISFASQAEGFGVIAIENKLAGGARFVRFDGKPAPRWRVEQYLSCANRFAIAPEPLAAAADLWEIELRARDALGDRRQGLFIDNRSICRARRFERTADGVAIRFDGVRLPDGEADVVARVRFAADGTSRWTLEADVRSARYVLLSTHYPMLRKVVCSGEADFLEPGLDLGAKLHRRAKDEAGGRAYGVLTYAPMMTAFMIGEAGIYIAAHDSNVNTKTLVVTGARDVAFSSPHPNGNFEVTVAAFCGDWWQAARLYRAWALTAPWCRKGRILDRVDYPRRLCEIPLWLNMHGGAEATSNALVRAKELFPDVTTGLHWHRWQAVPWEVGHYPEYFPAAEGVKDCIAYCRRIGQEPMLYTLPRLYSQSLLDFHFAKPHALRDESGNYPVERYGDPKGKPPPLVPICLAAKPWQDCVVDYCSRILDLGGCSVFHDQFASCPAKACYGKEHAHAPGGGDWFYRGQHEICSRVHDLYAPRDAFTTAEGSADQFIDVIDGLLNVTVRTDADVPFYHAVYNGYTTYFGSPENHDDDDDSFWALQVRETMWGQTLGWFHPLVLERPSKVELLRKLIGFRQKNLDCLAYGELLGEIRFDAGVVPAVKTTWLGRKAFPDWGNPTAKLSPTTYGLMPGVLGYEWRSGTTGRTCVFLANLRDRSVKVSFSDSVERREIELGPRELRRIEGRQEVVAN